MKSSTEISVLLDSLSRNILTHVERMNGSSEDDIAVVISSVIQQTLHAEGFVRIVPLIPKSEV